MNKRVLIYETAVAGHRGEYVRILSDSLTSLGFEVHVAIPKDSIASEWLQVHSISESRNLIHVPLDVPKSNSRLSQAKARLNLASSLAYHIKPTVIYIPSADGIAQAWGASLNPHRTFPGYSKVEGLLMRNTSAYPSTRTATPLDRIRRFLNSHTIARPNWTRLHTLDPISYAHSINKTGENSPYAMRLLPEPIEMPTSIPRDMASEMLKLPADDRITLSCPGEINTRKGCARLLEAFRLSNTSNKIRLVLFGPHSPELDLLIRTRYSDLVRDGHLLAENRILSNNEFNALFDTTDAIALLYQRHMGSSSILLKAAARGKELLTSQSGFLGWATETLGLGVTCDEDSVEAIASALCRLATDSKHDSHGKETSFQTIREYYTLKNHIAHWTSGIRELFSLSSSEGDKYEFPRTLLPSLQSYISNN